MLLRKIVKSGLPKKRNINQQNVSNRCRNKYINRLHAHPGRCDGICVKQDQSNFD
jgi:hypothetical protein